LGLIAGCISWAVIQAIHPAFEVPKEYHIEAMGAPQEKVEALISATARTDSKNMTLYWGLCGAILAGLLASSGRSLRAIAIAAPLGLVLGGLAGWLGNLAYAQLVTDSIETDMTRVVAAQAILLAGLGLTGSAGWAIARGSAADAPLYAFAGLAAGGLAGALYPVIMSVAMPGIDTSSLLPREATSRLVWLLLASGLIGLVMPLAARRRPPAAPHSADTDSIGS
jgi:hypothetical protein